MPMVLLYSTSVHHTLLVCIPLKVIGYLPSGQMLSGQKPSGYMPSGHLPSPEVAKRTFAHPD